MHDLNLEKMAVVVSIEPSMFDLEPSTILSSKLIVSRGRFDYVIYLTYFRIGKFCALSSQRAFTWNSCFLETIVLLALSAVTVNHQL